MLPHPVLPEGSGLVPEHLEGAIDVDLVGHADFDDGTGPATGLVAYHGHLAVRDDMEHATEVAKHHDPERHALDGARLAGRLDDVAHGELVLDQDEESGDDVLHQALGPEGNRQAEDAGAGEQRPNVEEEVERQQRGDQDDDDAPHAPEQLGDGLAPFFAEGEVRVVAIVDRLDDALRDELDRAAAEPRDEPDHGETDQGADEVGRVDTEELRQSFQDWHRRKLISGPEIHRSGDCLFWSLLLPSYTTRLRLTPTPPARHSARTSSTEASPISMATSCRP